MKKQPKQKTIRGRDAWETNEKMTKFSLENPDYQLISCDNYKATFKKIKQ